MNSYNLENFERPKLTMPNNGKKLLMHSCCAPCAGEIMEAVAASGIDTTIYFYNPNIHPREEYEIRKEENIRFAEKLGFDFIDTDYSIFGIVEQHYFEPFKVCGRIQTIRPAKRKIQSEHDLANRMEIWGWLRD